MHACCPCCENRKHSIGHADPCSRHQRGEKKITGELASRGRRPVETVELDA
jgi:hypothetical protein